MYIHRSFTTRFIRCGCRKDGGYICGGVIYNSTFTVTSNIKIYRLISSKFFACDKIVLNGLLEWCFFISCLFFRRSVVVFIWDLYRTDK